MRKLIESMDAIEEQLDEAIADAFLVFTYVQDEMIILGLYRSGKEASLRYKECMANPDREYDDVAIMPMTFGPCEQLPDGF